MNNGRLYKIRAIQNEDWQILKEIRLDALKNSSQSFGSNYENKLQKEDNYWVNKVKDSDNKFFVAFDGSIPVGLVRISLNDHEIPDDFAYLGSLYVKKEYRKQGIARSLIAAAEKFASTVPNLKGIYIEVYASLVNAVDLYKSIGYKIEKEQISDGQKDLVMIKKF